MAGEILPCGLAERETHDREGDSGSMVTMRKGDVNAELACHPRNEGGVKLSRKE
jgi:hypothetical protein